MLEVRKTKPKRRPQEAIPGLVKAIAACCAAAITPEPLTASSIVAKATPGLIEAAVSFAVRTEASLNAKAWAVLRGAFAYALADFFSTTSFARPPAARQLEILLEALLSRADILAEDNIQALSADHLLNPLKILVFRDFSRALTHEIKELGPTSSPDELRRRFESAAFNGIRQVKDLRPALYKEVEDGLSGSLALAQEMRAAVGRHEQFLIKAFSQASVFGQELTGITLSELYVRQRCTWKSISGPEYARSQKQAEASDELYDLPTGGRRTPNKFLYLDDLHETLHSWLLSEKSYDSVRVVAGGPGSGKSTFAKAFAIEAIDGGNFDVLFIPLQDLAASGSFETRIASLMRNRSELGFDRVNTPLDWMGKSAIDGTAPNKKLLLVCDGLDELAAPDSKEASAITTDFIQNLNTWLGHRNSAGCRVKALILGRTISAEEAFSKLHIDDEALLTVAGFLPVDGNERWKAAKKNERTVDPKGLASVDQRTVYWKNWCEASNATDSSLPAALKKDGANSANFIELTAEPLLLYLLIWTGFLGERWREASENRNIVYLEMFKKIYARDWGAASVRERATNAGTRSGHNALAEVSEEDFFVLQETLGLASWSSGGRTVSSAAFDLAKQSYLTDEQKDDLNELFSSSLKSVALQSYTRSVEGSDGGYEFVHKTLGEYLIGRALVGITERSTSILRDRVSDAKTKNAALLYAKVGSMGSITPEIDRFFADEVRLRFGKLPDLGKILDDRLVPVMNWVLRRGMPVHETADDIRKTEFVALTRAARRSTDALWSAVQHMSKNRPRTFEKPRIAPHLPIKWPLFSSFSTLFADLTDRGFVNETKRIPDFNFIDLTGQAVTEQDFGSIIFELRDGAASPRTWLPVSLRNSTLPMAQFYMAHLRNARLDDCNLAGAQLSQANLQSASLRSANLTGAILEDADLSRADLTGAQLAKAGLGGANLYQADLTRADLRGVRFGRGADKPSGLTKLYGTDFELSNAEAVDFRGSIIEDCQFLETNLARAKFYDSVISANNKFDNANLTGAEFTVQQLEAIDLTPSQRASVRIVEPDINKNASEEELVENSKLARDS